MSRINSDEICQGCYETVVSVTIKAFSNDRYVLKRIPCSCLKVYLMSESKKRQVIKESLADQVRALFSNEED